MLVDDGVSGKTMDRPGLREIMRLCEQGEVAHVIVLKLDRLTRQTRHLLSSTEDLFLAHKVELHSVSESRRDGAEAPDEDDVQHQVQNR